MKNVSFDVLDMIFGNLLLAIFIGNYYQCAGKHTGDILFAADNLKPTIPTDDNPALLYGQKHVLST